MHTQASQPFVLTRALSRALGGNREAVDKALTEPWPKREFKEVVLPPEAVEMKKMRRREGYALVNGKVPEHVAEIEMDEKHVETGDAAAADEKKEEDTRPREAKYSGLRAVLKVPDSVIWGYQAPLRAEASNHKQAPRKPLKQKDYASFREIAFTEKRADKESEDKALATGKVPGVYLDALFPPDEARKQPFHVVGGKKFVYMARGLMRALRRLYNEEDMRFGGLNEAGFKSLILGMLTPADARDQAASDYEIMSEPTAFKSTSLSLHGDLLVIHKKQKRGWLIELKYLAMPFVTPFEKAIAKDQRGLNKGIHRRAQRFVRRFRFVLSEQYMAEYANRPTHATWRIFKPSKKDKAKAKVPEEDEEDPGDHVDDINYFSDKPVMRVGDFCLKALEQCKGYQEFKFTLGGEEVTLSPQKLNLRYAAIVGFAHRVCVATDYAAESKNVYTDVMTAEDLECPEEHVHLPHATKRNVYVAQEGTSLQSFQAAWARATEDEKKRLAVLERVEIARVRTVPKPGHDPALPRNARATSGLRPRGRGLCLGKGVCS